MPATKKTEKVAHASTFNGWGIASTEYRDVETNEFLGQCHPADSETIERVLKNQGYKIRRF